MPATGVGSWAPSMGSGTGEEVYRTLSRTFSRRTQYSSSSDSDDDIKSISKAEDWKLMPQIRDIKAQEGKDQVKGRRLGVTWTNLTVKGVGADAAIMENAISQFNIPLKIKEGRRKAPLKTIVEESHGCVKPGEMLLVLGRPGAGCTTLLKVSFERLTIVLWCSEYMTAADYL
jgi:ATP-binding cassette subfamily G (WHITE) protein 2 (SNQ2)